jgi:hypothetical protein
MIFFSSERGNTRRRLIAGVIELMRTCKDVGQRAAGEPPIDLEGHCDLCDARPGTGRLLIGSHGLGHKVDDDGSIAFYPFPAEDPLDAMYWLCGDCIRLLRRDPDGLLDKLCA